MADISFILIYVDNVAASDAFYAQDPRPPGGRLLADLRHAAPPRRA